jgi:hypothetical protein
MKSFCGISFFIIKKPTEELVHLVRMTDFRGKHKIFLTPPQHHHQRQGTPNLITDDATCHT